MRTSRRLQPRTGLAAYRRCTGLPVRGMRSIEGCSRCWLGGWVGHYVRQDLTTLVRVRCNANSRISPNRYKNANPVSNVSVRYRGELEPPSAPPPPAPTPRRSSPRDRIRHRFQDRSDDRSSAASSNSLTPDGSTRWVGIGPRNATEWTLSDVGFSARHVYCSVHHGTGLAGRLDVSVAFRHALCVGQCWPMVRGAARSLQGPKLPKCKIRVRWSRICSGQGVPIL